ncbi:hypothetical protein CLU81_0368 [Flavobacterium sp. 9]|uniref:hypothetical protein n=1 Tax=Flavobacterium sp. 9 TaxID=2035198 RepID=UPI000C194173|nr:hypothetical protein [Flavobacterium sp. 9]PIF29983.1 hypothetical protein CLU81_0368 [Flavobacterium sp. 9]
MKKIITLIILFTNTFIFAQAPFPHISTSTFNAERVASFGVIDAPSDFLEITNSTVNDNSFIPSIWAHQQSDDRYVLRLFATTTSARDNGSIPIMIFRTEIRNDLVTNAPTGYSFPWGTTSSTIATRPVFAWENGTTQLMRILANGYVGIGTINPTALLHTNGTVRFENLPTTTTNTYVLTTDVNGNVSKQLSSSFGSSLTNSCNTTNFVLKKGISGLTCSQIFDNGTNVGIGTINPTALFQTNGTLKFENLADATNPFKLLGTDNLGNVFEYSPAALISPSTGDYDWLKPDGTFPTAITDNIYTRGNVGINVINPTATLNTNGTLKFENLADATNPFKILGTDNTGNVFEYSPAALIGPSTGDYDWLKPDGTFPIAITDNIYTRGNVGINVVNPTANFNTNGTLKFENLADAANPFKILGTDNTGNVFEYSPAALIGSGAGDFDWLKPDGTFPTSITDNIYTQGNVGINVVNPTANLNTNGTLKFENLADATTPFKLLGTDNAGNVFEYNPATLTGPSTGDFDWLKPDGTFPTSITDNIYTKGNVGINVVNPTANFNTNGTVKLENLADATSPFKILGTDNAGNVFEYNPAELTGSGSAVHDYDWLRPDGSFATSINDNIYTNGKVGINTSVFPTEVGSVDVSSYSLYAKGGILTEEVRIALDSEWADFVFDKNYKLEPLENVEKFINENKHLKDVPSAKEVEKNGIELGEMNKILLLKIEELTLHLIEMNKKIDAQNAIIEKLK